MIRVLHADDSLAYRALLRAALTDFADIELVAEADNEDAAVAEAARVRPDVVLLDMFEGSDGRCVEHLHEAVPGVRVVILSGHAREYGRRMRPQAAAYVEKGEPIDVLYDAIVGA